MAARLKKRRAGQSGCLELAEAAVDWVMHGGQRADEIVRRVVRGIGLTQRFGAERAKGLHGLTDESVAVLREAAVCLREPDVQPRRIERKACGRQRRGQKHARVFQHQGAQGKRAFLRKQCARALAEQFHIRRMPGYSQTGTVRSAICMLSAASESVGGASLMNSSTGHVARARLLKRLGGKRQKLRRGGRRGEQATARWAGYGTAEHKKKRAWNLSSENGDKHSMRVF